MTFIPREKRLLSFLFQMITVHIYTHTHKILIQESFFLPFFHELLSCYSFSHTFFLTTFFPGSVKRNNYEQTIHNLLRKATVLDHSISPCEENFIPNTKGQVYVMYIKMNSQRDYSTWLQVAKCFKIWDLDARGYHKSMWRFFLKGNQILVVGVPNSPYS